MAILEKSAVLCIFFWHPMEHLLFLLFLLFLRAYLA